LYGLFKILDVIAHGVIFPEAFSLSFLKNNILMFGSSWLLVTLAVFMIPIFIKLKVNFKHPASLILWSSLVLNIINSFLFETQSYNWVITIFALCWIYGIILNYQCRKQNKQIVFWFTLLLLAFNIFSVHLLKPPVNNRIKELKTEANIAKEWFKKHLHQSSESNKIPLILSEDKATYVMLGTQEIKVSSPQEVLEAISNHSFDFIIMNNKKTSFSKSTEAAIKKYYVESVPYPLFGNITNGFIYLPKMEGDHQGILNVTFY